MIVLVLAGCRDNGESPGNAPLAYPAESFLYTAYDSSDAVVVQGWFTLALKDSVSVIGKWHFWSIGTPMNIGPQVGDDSLAGQLSAGTIFIDLRPQYRDNNVLLTGNASGGGFAGTWMWISFAGPTGKGSFTAQPK
jgi:hypothetical protein